MGTWTVITRLDQYGHHDHIGAVPGYANAYGDSIHTTAVTADTADDAIGQAREAFRTVGPNQILANTNTPPPADQWTVVGLADNGGCASCRVTAVIEGEHEAQGHRDSMLSHRWTRVVDAPTAEEAVSAGYLAAAAVYDATWN
ncbi:hypothetical protein ACH4T9_13065 [Micromonospora sp. NPDC020750]|uniref:hypothetical protein n=1 Tax=unclassified Micromonospora TaxID=2617518 RepID=UPI0037A744CB